MFNFIRGLGVFLMDIIQVIVVSMSIFIVVYLFLMQPHQVKGNSMYPTFHDGEYLMTDKVTFKRREPIHGEVIVFKAPVNESFDFIKRVIGLPGDRVMVKDGHVYLNEQLLEEKYLPPDYVTRAGQFMHEGVEVTVPENNVLVMGDNRGHSSDSREWGFVPDGNIVGRAFFRYWPMNRAGIVLNTDKIIADPVGDTQPATSN